MKIGVILSEAKDLQFRSGELMQILRFAQDDSFPQLRNNLTPSEPRVSEPSLAQGRRYETRPKDESTASTNSSTVSSDTSGPMSATQTSRRYEIGRASRTMSRIKSRIAVRVMF